MSSVEIRAAIETDITDIQLCAQQAYGTYVQRMDRAPAPMTADFRSQIANGCVGVAINQSGLVGYVVAYPEGSQFMLESVAVLPNCSGSETVDQQGIIEKRGKEKIPLSKSLLSDNYFAPSLLQNFIKLTSKKQGVDFEANLAILPKFTKIPQVSLAYQIGKHHEQERCR